MARPNRKKKMPPPQPAPRLEEVVKSLRVPIELSDRIEVVRGDVAFADWARHVLHKAAYTSDEDRVREVLEAMRLRGVTVEMLLAAKAD